MELHREVGKDVTEYGLSNPAFSPTLRQLIVELKRNPKQFPKKNGLCKGARAADLKFHTVTFRAVFTLDEAARVVFVLSLDPHDAAYERAGRRLGAGKKR